MTAAATPAGSHTTTHDSSHLRSPQSAAEQVEVAGEVSDAVVVIGAGLVGASVGCALTVAGAQVHLEDRVPAHAIVAASRGAGVITAASARQVGLVVVAVPPNHAAAVVADALQRFPRAVVTDVASVKASVLRGVQRLGVDASRYVGSHPMAGNQFSGPLTASADLFTDRTWVITPHPGSSEQATTAVRQLALRCGARLVEMPVAAHDQAVAQVSHLPQLLSSLTAGHLREVPTQNLTLAGPGIRDVTRIAGSDPGLWRQIIAANREAIRTELTAVRDDLEALLAGLDDDDAVEHFLARGRDGARSLPGKHGTVQRELAPLTVEIPDEPGSLARLFTGLENAGVNIEDLAIEHDLSRQVGYLTVQVQPDRSAELAQAIRDRGWVVHAE